MRAIEKPPPRSAAPGTVHRAASFAGLRENPITNDPQWVILEQEPRANRVGEDSRLELGLVPSGTDAVLGR